jgi:DNA modification methylase
MTPTSISITKIKKNPSNPRIIKDEKYRKLVQSIKDFPEMLELRPLVLDSDMTVLGGNMRLTALRELGYKEAPCLIASELTDEQKRQFIIKDNLGYGEWDWDALGELYQLPELEDWGLDIPEFVSLEEKKEVEEDDFEVPAKDEIQTDIKYGDLFQIGPHRLLCGDSTKAEDVARLMDGKKADMVFTDPPYGVNYEGGHFHSGDVNIKRKREKLAADLSTAIYFDFLPIILGFIDGPCYMWFSDSKARDVYNAVFENSCEVHALIIWHKTNATYAAMNAQYKKRHEPCLYFKPKGSTLRWCGKTTEATVWSQDRDGINEFHPTQKPTSLASKALGNHNASLVLDAFLGSGSTMVAAHQLHRTCYGMELEPKYCQVIIDRMKKLDPEIEVKKLNE